MTTATNPEYLTYTDPCPGKKGEDRIVLECAKCSGTGSVEWGVDVDGAVKVRDVDGKVKTAIIPKVCFDCLGTGEWVRKVKNIRAAERRRVNEHNKMIDAAAEFLARREEIEAEEAARLEQYRTTHPEIATALDLVGGDFAASLSDQIREGRELTENQTNAILTAADKRREVAASTHIGTVGEKVEFEGRITHMKWIDNPYGGSCLWTITTTTGDIVKVFSSAKFLDDLNDSGETARFTATVKEHGEWQGAKETTVARIKKAK